MEGGGDDDGALGFEPMRVGKTGRTNQAVEGGGWGWKFPPAILQVVVQASASMLTEGLDKVPAA